MEEFQSCDLNDSKLLLLSQTEIPATKKGLELLETIFDSAFSLSEFEKTKLLQAELEMFSCSFQVWRLFVHQSFNL